MSRSNETSNSQTSGPYSGDFTEEVPSGEAPSGSGASAGPAPAKAKKSNVVFVGVMAVVVVAVGGLGYMGFRSHGPVKSSASTKMTQPAPKAISAPVVTKASGKDDASVLAGTDAPGPAVAPVVAPAASVAAAPGLNSPLSPTSAVPGPVLGAAPVVATPPTGGINPSPVVAPPAPAASVTLPATAAVPGAGLIPPPVNAAPGTLPPTPNPVVPAPNGTVIGAALPAPAPSAAPVAAPAPITTNPQPVAVPTATPVEAPAPIANAAPLEGQVSSLTVRVDNLEQRVTALENGQAQINIRLDRTAPMPVFKSHAAKPPVAKASSSMKRHSRYHRPNRVELIKPEAKVTKAAPVAKAPEVCHLASIVPDRAWIKNEDGTFSTYGIGDVAPNGSAIQRIDPTSGIITAKGKLACQQDQ